jgi:hypothetical protein
MMQKNEHEDYNKKEKRKKSCEIDMNLVPSITRRPTTSQKLPRETAYKKRLIASVDNTERGELDNIGMRRLIRFLNLIKFIDSKPGSKRESIESTIVIRTLTVMCMRHIVGEENYIKERTALMYFMGIHHIPTKLFWIAMRQYGKSVSVEKFIAAMFILGYRSDCIIGLWGQNHQKAIDSLRGANEVINWVINETKYPHKPRQSFKDKDNAYVRSCTTCDGVRHYMEAVASTPKSSRGKRPWILLADEFAWCSPSWYDYFVKGLESVEGRVFIFITTPPTEENNLWSLELFNSLAESQRKTNSGDWFLINTIKHCLYCQQHNHYFCPHKQGIVPEFNSVTKQLNTLMTTDKSKMDRYFIETCGILPNFSSSRFPQDMLRMCKELPRITTPEFENDDHEFYIGIDPPSKNNGFGFHASMFDVHGQYVIFGSCQLDANETDYLALTNSAARFISKIRTLPYIGNRVGFKFIECNNNSYTSDLISTALGNSYNMRFPFTTGGPSISENKFVLTNDTNKDYSSISFAKSMSMKRIRFASEGVYLKTGEVSSYTGEKSWEGAIDTLLEQCSKWRWRLKGVSHSYLSSVVPGTADKGDVVMATFIGYYWGETYRSEILGGVLPQKPKKRKVQHITRAKVRYSGAT